MSKFKVGDKVRCKLRNLGCCRFEFGEVSTIVEKDAYEYYTVKDPYGKSTTLTLAFMEKHFELPKQEPKLELNIIGIEEGEEFDVTYWDYGPYTFKDGKIYRNGGREVGLDSICDILSGRNKIVKIDSEKVKLQKELEEAEAKLADIRKRLGDM